MNSRMLRVISTLCALYSPAGFAHDAKPAPTEPASPYVEESPEPLLPRLVASWGNDQFYIENGDDVGITQDFTLEAHLLDATNDFSLRAHHRLLVERFGPRRTDEFTWRLRWLHEHAPGPLRLSGGASAAMALSGNFGGAWLQNTWHETVDNGYTFGHGLPDEYSSTRAGFVPGVVLGLSWLPRPWLRLSAGFEGAAALGRTGLGQLILYDAIELESSPEGFRLALALGLDLERRWTRDPLLRLPGGYETNELTRSMHGRLAFRGDSWELAYEAITNVGGAGTQFGRLYLLWGGGNAFRHQHSRR